MSTRITFLISDGTKVGLDKQNKNRSDFDDHKGEDAWKPLIMAAGEFFTSPLTFVSDLIRSWFK